MLFLYKLYSILKYTYNIFDIFTTQTKFLEMNDEYEIVNDILKHS